MHKLNNPYYRVRNTKGEWLNSTMVGLLEFTPEQKDSRIFNTLAEVKGYLTGHKNYGEMWRDLTLKGFNDELNDLELCIFMSTEINAIQLDENYKDLKPYFEK